MILRSANFWLFLILSLNFWLIPLFPETFDDDPLTDGMMAGTLLAAVA